MKRPEIVKSIQNALHKVAPGIKVILYFLFQAIKN